MYGSVPITDPIKNYCLQFMKIMNRIMFVYCIIVGLWFHFHKYFFKVLGRKLFSVNLSLNYEVHYPFILPWMYVSKIPVKL